MPTVNNATEYSLDAGGVQITLMRGLTALYQFDTGDDVPAESEKDLFHTHSNYELFCARSGPILLCFEDSLCTLETGQAAIVPPGKCHHAVFSDPADKAFAFNYMLRYLRSSETARTLQQLHLAEQWHCLLLDRQMDSLAQFLNDAFLAGNGTLCCMYMLTLLLRFAQSCTPTDATTDYTPDNTAGRLYKIDQVIFSHHTGKLPLTSLARELHLSPRQLSRIIHKHYGVSYRTKNKQLRMQSAARRLQNGEDIALVAAAEGYHSLSAFYAAFRKTFGMTPAQYKRQKDHTPQM